MYTLDMHLKNPTVNTWTTYEEALAISVAALTEAENGE